MTESLERWQRHANECDACRLAASADKLCPIGASISQSYHQTSALTPLLSLNQGADSLVLTNTGIEVAVRAQYSGTSVTISQRGGDVLLRIPERDVNVIGQMKAGVDALAQLAQFMGTMKDVDAETRDIIKACRRLAVDLQGEIERRMGTY